MKYQPLAAALAAALSTCVFAQTQQVRPPIAVYWMSVETAGGMGSGLPPGMAGMMPPGMAGGKRLKLDLGSSQQAAGEARAAHAIPAGLAMGPSLPLVAPPREPTVRETTEEPEREFERPKGRMLVYWGCGESVRAGQPVVFDFASMDPQQAARVFRSRNIARPRAPGPGRNRGYGEWPNRENSQPVPAAGSLRGDHVIAGNYSPEIRFTIGDRHDFMEAVVLDAVRRTPGGGLGLNWKLVPTAIGYFATAIGQGENQSDVVMWSSSEVQEFGQALLDFIPPAEVARLIREKVVMTAQSTECAVPAGVFRGEGAMLNFIAYGDELNLVHPPRPNDPKQTWEQQWAVKVRLKSTAMTLLAEGRGGEARGRGRQRSEDSPPRPAQAGDSAPPAQAEREREQPPSPVDAVQEGVKALRRILPF